MSPLEPTPGQDGAKEPLSLPKREKRLADRLKPTPQELKKNPEKTERFEGFKHDAKDTYEGLTKTMGDFQERVLDSAGQVVRGEILPDQMPHFILAFTGLPGVGKTKLAMDIGMEQAAIVVEKCRAMGIMDMDVFFANEKKYEDEYINGLIAEGKMDFDKSKPFPTKHLLGIWSLMDRKIAQKLKENPHTIIIMDRPSGTELVSLGGQETLRPYGLTPARIAQGEGPYAEMNIDMTAVGIVGSPSLLEKDMQRHAAMQEQTPEERERIADALSKGDIESIRDIANLATGGSENIVWYVQIGQEGMIKQALETMKRRSGGTLSREDFLGGHVPEDIWKILPLGAVNELKSFYEADNEGMWEEILSLYEARKKAGKDSYSPVTLAWQYAYLLAGASVLRYSIGRETNNPNVHSTIIYNDASTRSEVA
ncbi:MAG TPA: hypothetical protein VEW42_02935 [Candidatus Eisenbacteria bacterium]|nr:hypothetical protein [Candidatus Eisenbacteria bacterium]